jgi:hypothetical protein
MGLLGFVLAGLAAIRPAEEGPKNLKVLPKNIKEDSLYYIMDGFEGALGVKCGFCHIMKDSAGKEDYARDSLPTKDSCRSMMRMTMEINNRYFAKGEIWQMPGETVTCYTCHRGQQKPPAKK